VTARPTIAIDLRALVPDATGIGVYTRELLLALAARVDGNGSAGAHPRFRYLGVAHRPVRCAAELAAAGIALEHQAAPLGVLWQQLLLPRRLAAGDVDLFWSPLTALPLSLPVPAVITVHDLTALLLPETHSAKVRWSLIPFLARSLARARRVVAVSQATADDVAFHFPETRPRLRVVHEGVGAAYAPAPPERVAAIRRELGCPEGYLLYVGTVEPRKNLGVLLDAWELLRQQAAPADGGEPALPLVLAGGYGWGSRALVRRIEGLAPHGLRSLGRVAPDLLVRLYQGATLFVYPSLYEGFGLPPLEAMACGAPTVVSDASSLPEVVGDAAVKVPPGDAAALAAALEGLLAAPAKRAELARRGPERAALFRWDAAAARMEAIFAEALAETGPAAGPWD
jgi:glycosyltransferase involved in cell wall biosynthesis